MSLRNVYNLIDPPPINVNKPSEYFYDLVDSPVKAVDAPISNLIASPIPVSSWKSPGKLIASPIVDFFSKAINPSKKRSIRHKKSKVAIGTPKRSRQWLQTSPLDNGFEM